MLSLDLERAVDANVPQWRADFIVDGHVLAHELLEHFQVLGEEGVMLLVLDSVRKFFVIYLP